MTMREGIRVRLEPETLIIRSASHVAHVEIIIQREDDAGLADDYAVMLQGLPSGMYTLADTLVTLYPRDSKVSRIVIRPLEAESQDGAYPYSVIVRSGERVGHARGTIVIAFLAQLPDASLDSAANTSGALMDSPLARHEDSDRRPIADADSSGPLAAASVPHSESMDGQRPVDGATSISEETGVAPTAVLVPASQEFIAEVETARTDPVRLDHPAQTPSLPPTDDGHSMQGPLWQRLWTSRARIPVLALVAAMLLLLVFVSLPGCPSPARQLTFHARQQLCISLKVLCLPTDPVPGSGPSDHHRVKPPFLDFFKSHWGEYIFGFGSTEPFIEHGTLVQYTNHFRLEWVNGQVSIAPLGRLLTSSRRFPTVPPFTSSGHRLYFPRTGHSLGGASIIGQQFLAFWNTYDGRQLLGEPISEITYELNNDCSNRHYWMQWFENGRLEYHPENPPRYAVELGLVGNQDLQNRGWML